MHQIILFLSILFILTSCANTARVVKVIDPQKVGKKDLKQLPYSVTPKYNFKVTTVRSLRDKTSRIVREVDEQFSEYEACENITDSGRRARKFLISVVEGTFECEYHFGRCNGEYDSKNELIIVSYKAFNKRGILPLLKHEWAHAYKILRSNHSNLDEVKKCTRY